MTSSSRAVSITGSTETAATDAVAGQAAAGLSGRRLLGVDAARGVAVLGMCLVHTRPTAGPTWLVELAEGRAAALFAVLSGVSLALMSGGAQPQSELAVTRWRIVVRAAVLMVLGLLLELLHTPVIVILCYYAVYFLLCLPLLRLRAPALAVLAVGAAIIGPVGSFVIRSHMDINEFGGAPTFGSLTDVGALIKNVLLTGTYPVMTWIPFVLAGLAVGRLGLHAVRPAWVGVAGAALTGVGFGGSWFAQSVLGGRQHLIDMLRPVVAESGLSPADILDTPALGTVSTTSWWNLTLAQPHSGTPFEIIGSVGVAVLAVGVLTMLCRSRWGQHLLRPLIATGAMSLSTYSLHIVVLAVLPPRHADAGTTVPLWGMSMWLYYLLLITVITLFATVWMAVFRRGPLEYVVHLSTARVGRGS